MSKPKRVHPIRRVREALKTTPEEMGLRQYATGTGFAKFLGRSSSLIRNVECGITTNWENLAATIQRKTDVSSKWLLSDPKPDVPILDVHGRQWSPSRALDPLRPRKGMPDWRQLVETCPGVLPGIIAEFVKAELVLELSLGNHRFLENLVTLLHRAYTFENPALEGVVQKASSEWNIARQEALWKIGQRETNSLNQEVGYDLAQLQKEGSDRLTLEKMQYFLGEEGFGWTAKLPDSAREGIIEQAKEFNRQKFPEFREAAEER